MLQGLCQRGLGAQGFVGDLPGPQGVEHQPQVVAETREELLLDGAQGLEQGHLEHGPHLGFEHDGGDQQLTRAGGTECRVDPQVLLGQVGHGDEATFGQALPREAFPLCDALGRILGGEG